MNYIQTSNICLTINSSLYRVSPKKLSLGFLPYMIFPLTCEHFIDHFDILGGSYTKCKCCQIILTLHYPGCEMVLIMPPMESVRMNVSEASEIFLSLILKNDPCLKNGTLKRFLGNFWRRNKYYHLREVIIRNKKKVINFHNFILAYSNSSKPGLKNFW